MNIINQQSSKQQKPPKMQSDRFIPSSNYKNRHITNFSSLKQTDINFQDDPQVTKLYRMLVMNDSKKQYKQNNEIQQYNSLKSITNIQNNENRSYQYLQKLGIDINKLSIGPTVIKKADRILQALSLSDNFYLNLLDCSKDSIVGVGLSRGIYLWKPTGQINRIRQQPDISCIQFHKTKQNIIACGNKLGGLQIWDIQHNQCILQYNYHQARIGTLTWMNDNYSILSGSKDSNIYSYDIRTNRRTNKYRYHTQQITSLKAQPYTHNNINNNNNNNNSINGLCDIFASGSNDHNLLIWNTRMNRNPIQKYKHNAAIKGLSWHPTKNGILASGGGTQDRCIKIWNINTNQLVKCIDTGSQVCNLMYIKNGENLISTHGFNKFQCNVWDSSTLQKQQTLIGHTKRVLYLAAQPNGETIVTGAGDQTIRFWKLKSNKKKQQNKEISDSIMTIR